ncbi:DUF1016 N-terminal domain-containing protein [Arthrobacter sp. AET 35A]|uniref:DUF1016 N-terminal domain-containing protein n=1 Tax=Arthrobacter sp. AET 35A TaxID=2292643 RepID=UPI001781EDC5|nr:DUF1016 N-terminal domain-containing protein [Arthrobacter sp. AET 35A]MBE0011077.1 DUF1016 family protein [Arthrobacter sp. AET 35A]
MTPAEFVFPNGCRETLEVLKGRVRDARLQSQRSVNIQLIELYGNIGIGILTQRDRQGWGADIARRLADDLRTEFPDMTGLSYRNLQYMRAFAAVWTGQPIVQQPVAQLPWGHIVTLLDKLPGADRLEGGCWHHASSLAEVRDQIDGDRN